MAHHPFTSLEQSRISSLLSKKLHPELLSSRPGFNNTRLVYVEGWQVIDLANRVFGFNGWSSELRSFETDVEFTGGKYCVVCNCVARVTLKDGSYKEDTGVGTAENQKAKGAAVEKARKEAATDALKRALRQFGSALGNCCYDKEYLKRIERREVVDGMMRRDEGKRGDSFENEEFSNN